MNEQQITDRLDAALDALDAALDELEAKIAAIKTSENALTYEGTPV